MTFFADEFEKRANLDSELEAPLCNLDIEEWLETFEDDHDDSNTPGSDNRQKLSSNLVDSIEICNSLEDLVKTFDQNVKKCLSTYKDIDIGQLAPVQVRSQEQLMNESQMWYTLTGNFGNLLPIPSDYGSKSLFKKYHRNSLDIKDKEPRSRKSAGTTTYDTDFEDDFEEFYGKSSSYSATNMSDRPTNSDSFFAQDTDEFEFEDSDDDQMNRTADDEDDDFLRDQLDMHSMILSKSVYGEGGNDEPYITADEVLNEIETMMSLQEEYYDEMTPDSGCFSICNNNSSFTGSDGHLSTTELPIDVNGSYLTYIKTFAVLTDSVDSPKCSSNNIEDEQELALKRALMTKKTDLTKFNIYELNDLIEQIEANTKVLSDDLVHELANRDELEFEKETKNTFISLLMSIQEKRRMLNSESLSTSQYSSISTSSHRSNSALKKRYRRSMINLDSSHSTHLTTIIPFNNEIQYTVQHLQILNKLLKAIDDDSYQVPELLTNYILKVVCPT